MFTGIVQCIGTMTSLTRRGGDAVTEVTAPWDASDIRIGDSIAVDGVCLTVTDRSGDRFRADISGETLERTTLGQCRAGDRVNLEKALRLGDFVGGHLVLGHVDGIGRLREKIPGGSSTTLSIEAPPALMRYVVEKGSVAVDGISLTVNRCLGNRFQLRIIPQTLRETTLEGKHVGDAVNVETDILGKYVEKMLQPAAAGSSGLRLETLAQHGFLK